MIQQHEIYGMRYPTRKGEGEGLMLLFMYIS
jgi:hypothetical protein